MILITGINGFLGTRLVELITDKMNIVGYGRKKGITADSIPVFDSLDEIAENHVINTIYHLASFIPYGAYNQPDQRFTTDNIEMTIRLTKLFPAARIIYASSVSIYGNTLSEIITLDSPMINPTLYGLSKLAGETVVRQQASYGIVRFSSIIGKGMKTASFLPAIIKSARNNKTIKLLGTGTRIQNYIDVRDAARLLLLIADDQTNIITLGISPEHYSNKEVATKVQAQINCEINYEGQDNSENCVYKWPESLDKIKFLPKHSIDDTIADIIYEI